MARHHCCSGIASFSRISTGAVWMLNPITAMLHFSFVYPETDKKKHYQIHPSLDILLEKSKTKMGEYIENGCVLSAPAALRRSRAEMLAGEESDGALTEEDDESHLVLIRLKKQGFLACSWINSNCDFRPGA